VANTSAWFRGICVGSLLAAALAACSGENAGEAPHLGREHAQLSTPAGAFPTTFLGTTATLLSDGRVLVAGGVVNNAVTGAAVVYDPGANQWLATGSLAQPRTGATAIRLPDGRVLVSGGQTTSALLASNEVYDPVTGTFGPFASLSVPRSGHAAVLLSNGGVFIAGGSAGVTNGDKPDTFGGGVASWLGPWHGKVSLTRVTDHSILALFDADSRIYDESTSKWHVTASPIKPRRGQKVIRLADGRLLMLGGQISVPLPSGTGTTLVDTELAELFDPVTETWSATASLSRPSQEGDLLVNIPGGDVALIGGKLRVERYSAAEGTWSLRDPLSHPPLTATSLNAGGVLVTGVLTLPNGVSLPSAELYDAASPVCTQTTCAAQGKQCGPLDDGCGGTLLCGSCPNGGICNGGSCSGGCAPTTCSAVGVTCGVISDGCGGTLSCGACAAGQTCTNGTCVVACVPSTCSGLGKSCGTAADGCGGTLSCGSCVAGQTCSSGVCVAAPPSGCSHSECTSGTKLTGSCSSCAQTVCATDSYCCNNSWDATCVNEAKSMCGSLCSTACTPSTCASLGKNCGSVANGCGGTLSCGTCAAGQTCSNNTCVTAPPSSCAHSQCTTGTKLTASCSSCVQSICAVDSYCCNTAWDSICRGEVTSVCKLSCP